METASAPETGEGTVGANASMEGGRTGFALTDAASALDASGSVEATEEPEVQRKARMVAMAATAVAAFRFRFIFSRHIPSPQARFFGPRHTVFSQAVKINASDGRLSLKKLMTEVDTA